MASRSHWYNIRSKIGIEPQIDHHIPAKFMSRITQHDKFTASRHKFCERVCLRVCVCAYECMYKLSSPRDACAGCLFIGTPEHTTRKRTHPQNASHYATPLTLDMCECVKHHIRGCLLPAKQTTHVCVSVIACVNGSLENVNTDHTLLL